MTNKEKLIANALGDSLLTDEDRENSKRLEQQGVIRVIKEYSCDELENHNTTHGNLDEYLAIYSIDNKRG